MAREKRSLKTNVVAQLRKPNGFLNLVPTTNMVIDLEIKEAL